ncbi:MAG TPA: sugar kinase [Pyrinomonadaceae bacterium]|jgi:2-dehydro-3-deoxygluconokinase
MNELHINSDADCRWDLISLGEVLLRFDSGDERIHNARSFRVWDGGGEYNVARGLAKVFRRKTAIVTALADNALGRLAEDMIWQAGVDSSQILWRETDGAGAGTRNGIYYIERGFGVRAPASCFDRANTAVSQLQTGDIDWNAIFKVKKTRWLHTGGIFVGLSESTPEVAREAMRAARENGAIVSYDLNYRDSLWKERGGKEAANEINRQLLPFADAVFGVTDFDSRLSQFDDGKFHQAAQRMNDQFPNLRVIASTLRDVQTASLHNFGAACFTGGEVFTARARENLDVLDRVGSGDAFASGFIYGFLSGKNAQYAVECGAAHACLAMTTPGDNSMAQLSEIESLISGESANVKR